MSRFDYELMDTAWDDDERRDDRRNAELDAERRERTLSALYSAAMLGLAEEDLRHLCTEAGVTYADLERYTPSVLRASNQPTGGDATDQLPF